MKAVFLVVCLVLSISCQFIEEEQIIVLTESNFEKALKVYEYLLVSFYAPFDEKSKTFLPEFSKAAASLKDDHIFMGKVDITQNKKLSARFEIASYPTLKFFRKGKVHTYTGRKSTAQELIDWMQVHSVPIITNINNMYELEQFKEAQKLVLMYFARNSNKEIDQKTFESVADDYEGVYFGLGQSQELRDTFGLDVDEKIVLFTPYENKEIKFNGDITIEFKQFITIFIRNIGNFIKENSYPLVLSYNKREEYYVEVEGNPTILLIVDKVDSEEETIFRELAAEMKGEILFTILNKKNLVQREALAQNKFEQIFSLKQLPGVVIFDTTNKKNWLKYKFTKEITNSNLREFILNWKNGKIDPFFKSQKIPPANPGPVKMVVGQSFQWEVIDPDYDVLMVFYAPWCNYSKKFLPVFEEVAKLLQDVNKNIKFAKMDATENEIPDLMIRSYPTIKFFKKGKEIIDVVDFKEEKTVEGILRYLKANTSHQWIEPPKQKKKDDL